MGADVSPTPRASRLTVRDVFVSASTSFTGEHIGLNRATRSRPEITSLLAAKDIRGAPAEPLGRVSDLLCMSNLSPCFHIEGA